MAAIGLVQLSRYDEMIEREKPYSMFIAKFLVNMIGLLFLKVRLGILKHAITYIH